MSADRIGTVAVIPARGGSKGVPGKNLRSIAGRPLIQHSIQHALGAALVGRVYVTTDDGDIAQVSRDSGADVITRPADLATDTSSSESALLHAVEQIAASEGALPEKVLFLQCTSPIRTSEDIDAAIALFESEGADSLLSVVESHRFFWREEDGRAVAVNYDPMLRPRRQDMAPGYMENGSLYLFDTKGFLKHRNRLFGKIVMYRMAADSAYEIDDETDIAVVSALLERRREDGMTA